MTTKVEQLPNRSKGPHTVANGSRWPAERYFYTGMALVMLATVFVGFARTFFLKPWFPEAAPLAPPEPFFYYAHGVTFTAWILLMVVQSLLIAGRRVHLHRTIGWFGAGLASALLVTGTIGALMAARRPTGFIGVSTPPLPFLAGLTMGLMLFAIFASFAIVYRRDTQSHKRFMLLAWWIFAWTCSSFRWSSGTSCRAGECIRSRSLEGWR